MISCQELASGGETFGSRPVPFGTCSAAYTSYSCKPVLHQSRARDRAGVGQPAIGPYIKDALSSSRRADCGPCYGASGSPTTQTWKGPSHCGVDRRGSGSAGDPAQHKEDARACGAARRVIFTGDLPGSNPRLWSDDEQSGSNSLEGKTDHLLEWPQLLSSRTASPITYSVELHFVSATSPMELAGATGLEPAASCVTGRRSNQLNHARRVPDRAH